MTLESYARNFSRNVCRHSIDGFRVSIHGMVIDASGVSHPEPWERRVSRARGYHTHDARMYVRTIFVSRARQRDTKKNNDRASQCVLFRERV